MTFLLLVAHRPEDPANCRLGPKLKTSDTKLATTRCCQWQIIFCRAQVDFFKIEWQCEVDHFVGTWIGGHNTDTLFWCDMNKPAYQLSSCVVSLLNKYAVTLNWFGIVWYISKMNHFFSFALLHMGWKRRSQSTVSREGFGICWMSRHEQELDMAVAKMLLYGFSLQ